MRILSFQTATTVGAALCLALSQANGQPPKPDGIAGPPRPLVPPKIGASEQVKSDPPLVPPIILKGAGGRGLAFSPDARWLASATGSGAISLWNVDTGKLLWRRELFDDYTSVYQIAFSPNGKMLACATAATRVMLLDVADGKQLASLRHPQRSAISSIAFSANGRWLASAGRELMVWDLKTLEIHQQLLRDVENVSAVAFSPDSKVLASASTREAGAEVDSTIHLWAAETGKQLDQFEDAGGKGVWRLMFSPCGTLLASGSRVTVRVRVLATARAIMRIDVPGYDLCFSPDGDLLFLSGRGRIGCGLWHIETGTEVQTVLKPYHNVERVAYSPNGRVVALGTAVATVLIQKLAPANSLDSKPSFSAQVIEKLWTNLGADDAKKRYEAIWDLASEPNNAVALIRHRMKRREPRLDRLTGQSAVRVLELTETKEARELLQGFADDFYLDAVKLHAVAALDRLKMREEVIKSKFEP